MFNPSRAQVRQFFTETWRKHRNGELLSGMESMTAAIIAAHPEYHALLESGAPDQEFPPEQGQTNPYLHLGMHLAIEEQLAIDQPPGVRKVHDRLAQKLDSEHDAQHRMMECLGEVLWRAQQEASAPDSDAYLECLQRCI